MGRGKLSLNLISNHKSRSSTFQKRKKSLMKKAYELSTLCDVRTCVLIHGPAPEQPGDRVEFHAWPTNHSNEIEGMIRAYKSNLLQKQSMKCFDLNDFFSDRMRKIETETSKLLKNVEEIKYPWDERLEWLSEDELKVFMDDLGSKIEVADGMIDFMEADYDHIIGEGASTIDIAELFEEQPHNLLQIEGNSLPMIPMEEFDFSDFLIDPNEAHYTYRELQSLLEDDTDQMHNQLDYGGDFEYFDDGLILH